MIHSDSRSPNRRDILLATGCVLLACIALILSVAITDTHVRMARDEIGSYMPTIEHFANGGSAADYPAAPTPGFYVLMAGFLKFGHFDLTALRIVCALITALFAAFLAKVWAGANKPYAAWIIIPAAVSLYILPSGVWLLPDNLAWLTVLAALWLALLPAWRAWHVVTAALLGVITVLVRQSNLWVLTPELAAIVWGFGKPWPAAKKLGVAVIVCVPAVLTLAYFIWLWGGHLTPPQVHTHHESINFAVPAWFLVLFAANAVFYAPLFRGNYAMARQQQITPRLFVFGGLLGLVPALLAASYESKVDGRYGGFWQLVKLLPVVDGRSLFVICGAVAGGILLTFLFYQIRNTQRLILIVATLSFVAAQSANHEAFDRYYVGYVDILIALAATSSPSQSIKLDKWAVASLGVLFCINLVGLITGI